MNTLLIAVFYVIHISAASVCIRDLYVVSKRAEKTSWMIFIMAIPLFAPLIYLLTMKRWRQSNKR